MTKFMITNHTTRGFLLLLIGKFFDANRFFKIFFYWHEALLRVANFQKKDDIKRKPLGPGYNHTAHVLKN